MRGVESSGYSVWRKEQGSWSKRGSSAMTFQPGLKVHEAVQSSSLCHLTQRRPTAAVNRAAVVLLHREELSVSEI